MPSEELELGEARKVAATKIAAIQRGNQARKSIKEEHEAAVKLQAVHRGMAMRRSNFNLAEATHVAARASPSASAIAAKKPLTMAQLGLRTGLPKNPVPALRFLKFFAWWHEMGTKRYMELCFDLETELFQVVLDKQVQVLDPSIVNQPLKESIFDVISTDTKVMSMHLHEKLSGNQHAESLRRPHLQCWDLHGGCRINVLGRPTTLMQCDLVTAQWLEYHSSRLELIKQAMQEALRKYETVPMAAAFGPQRGGRGGPGGGKQQGTTDLRTLLNQVEALGTQLEHYRPNMAAGLLRLVHLPK